MLLQLTKLTLVVVGTVLEQAKKGKPMGQGKKLVDVSTNFPDKASKDVSDLDVCPGART